jgi:hypothetical protein
MIDQSDAVLLAAINCIGDAAYDNQGVAAYLFEWLKALHVMGKGEVAAPHFLEKCKERYGFNPLDDEHKDMSGEDLLFLIADTSCRGNAEDASRKMLQDFRRGRLGNICLQLAPQSAEDNGQLEVKLGSETRSKEKSEQQQSWEENRLARAEAAIETAQKQGLELPPMIQDEEKEEEVGKGLFDGW